MSEHDRPSPPPDAAGLQAALFAASPRADVLCALSHLQAARARLAPHARDNVFRELVEALDVAQLRLHDRLRAYPK